MEHVHGGFSVGKNAAMPACEALIRREFYDGDLAAENGDFGDIGLEKLLHGPLAVTRLSVPNTLSFRRAPQHIRKNRVGLRVLFVVLTGSVQVVRATGVCEITAGSAGFLDPGIPFSATARRSRDDHHTSYQVIIPSDLFISHLHDADRLSEPFSLESDEGRTVRALLDTLNKFGNGLSDKTADLLSRTLLEATADHLRNSGIVLPRRENLVNRRLADIEHYIKMNLSDPELSYDKVAVSCGISPRYLCVLLKANNTSYSEQVWKNRMPRARDALISPKMLDRPIQEIAYMSGFKNAAHFSRMFKATYGLAPRDYRARHMDEAAELNDAECRANHCGSEETH